MIVKIVSEWGPVFIVLLASTTTLLVLRYFLFKRKIAPGTENRLSRQLLMFVLTAIAIVLIILALPISDSLQAQFLSLLGILFTAAIALSSTTFVGNAMAGLMLRAVENFRPGDFIRAGEHFGRVSERGLLHTEIQTEDRDLTTLPNLFLVTNPVTVVHSSGTIVSATVSLGYDIPHLIVIDLLKEAAENAELKEAFVHIVDLGDFSIVYRVAGFLSEVKTLISARSRLRSCMLNTLHQNKIEIVSPTFMNQRRIEKNESFIPKAPQKIKKIIKEHDSPEEIIFDKAEQAESKELALEQIKKINERKKLLEEALAKADSEAEKIQIKNRLLTLENYALQLDEQINAVLDKK